MGKALAIKNRLKKAKDLYKVFDNLRGQGYLVYEDEDTKGEPESLYIVETQDEKELVKVLFEPNETGGEYKQSIIRIYY